MRYCQSSLNEKPKQAPANNLMALCFINMKKYAQAKSYLEKALKAD